MKFIYIVGGLVGLYAPTKMLYKYFFNQPRVLPSLKQKIVNSLLPHQQMGMEIRQRYIQKRDGIIVMALDHQGKIQSPTIIDNSSPIMKENKESQSIFVQAIISRNDIYFINKDDTIAFVEKFNKKYNLKIDFQSILESIKPLLFYKYPLIYTSTQHSLQIIEIKLQGEQEKTISIRDTQAKQIFSKQQPYRLVLSTEKKSKEDSNQTQIAQYQVDENGLLNCSHEGVVFIFYKDKMTNQVVCQQILDNSNTQYVNSFKIFQELKIYFSKKLLQKMQKDEDEILFKQSRMYHYELEDLIKDQALEIIILQNNGIIGQVKEVEGISGQILSLNSTKNRHVQIFKYLNYFQKNCDISNLLIFNQSVYNY